GKLFHCSNFCTVPSGWRYSRVVPYSTLYMMVRLVGGGGVRSWVLRWLGPASGMTPVSSPEACVLGGALTGGGGGLSAGGKLTMRLWARTGPVCAKKIEPPRHKATAKNEREQGRRPLRSWSHIVDSPFAFLTSCLLCGSVPRWLVLI